MNELATNKIKYILLRYKIDSKDLSINLRLELLKRWIKSCVESEEYEMASVLKDKRNELIRSLRIAKVGDKHIIDKIIIKFKWALRKIKRKFFPL
jgi:hypothetical protein